MRQRPIMKLYPSLEAFEEKKLLSGDPLTAPLVNLKVASAARSLHSAETSGALIGGAGSGSPGNLAGRARAIPEDHNRPSPGPGLTLFRITDPTLNIARLVPPFNQVLVQSTLPVAGAVYNVLFVSVRNGTARTFDASNGFRVRVTGQSSSFPVLTGTEQWKPGQFIVFYILTKKYYPLRPVTNAGFQFDFAGSSGVAIPGPSGIYLRIKYNPATFASVLNQIVAHGPGAKGHELGLPDTALWSIISAKTDLVPL
jgi:hypothetical protein